MIIKKIAYLLSLCLLLLSAFCCQNYLVEEQNAPESYNAVNSSILTRSENVVKYMGHSYAISKGPLSIEEARFLFSDSTLVATHKALCIVPESMEQLHSLEADKALMIFYHPLGYELLPEPLEEIEGRENDEEGNLFSDKFDYFNDKEEYTARIICPIYVLWPADRSIPIDLDYEFLFDAYLQQGRRDSGNVGPLVPNPYLSGYLKSYDNRLGQYTPLKNVRLEYRGELNATRIAYTDTSGYFYLPDGNSDYPLIVKLQNDKFTVRDSTTSNVKSFALRLDIHFSPFTDEYDFELPSNFFLDTYKAAEYYFYGNNDLLNCVPRYDTLGVSIDIHAIDEIGDYLGGFNRLSTPYINIWNAYKDNYTGACSRIFGTVTHELGHATHYALDQGASISETETIVKESFASFFGWYNVFRYYSSLIGSNHYLVHSICTQGRQMWTPSSSSNYSPIFVDLFDDYNQHTHNSNYNNDPISYVPVSFIRYCALGPTTFQAVYNNLLSGVGTYYSSDEFNTFIAPYSAFY